MLDHHASAERDLAGLGFAEFDSNFSGVGLTWHVLNPHKPAPCIVRYVEDRDLWRWALPYNRLDRWVNAIESLIFDERRRHEISQAGREYVRSCAIQGHVAEWIDLLLGLGAAPSPALHGCARAKDVFFGSASSPPRKRTLTPPSGQLPRGLRRATLPAS